MKKINLISCIICILSLLFCSCSNQSPKSSFDRIMSLENTNEGDNHDSIIFRNIDELLEYYNSRDLETVFLKGKVLKTEYHICFKKDDMIMDGYALITLSIESSTNSKYKYGQLITLKQDSYVQFKYESDAYSFATGNPAKSLNEMLSDLSTLDDFDKVLKMEEEIEYVRHFKEDDMPMKEGEIYSMVAYPLDNELFGFQYSIPNDSLLSEITKKYGWSFDDIYLSVAEEIRELVG